jgi:hypothetical protein
VRQGFGDEVETAKHVAGIPAPSIVHLQAGLETWGRSIDLVGDLLVVVT